MEYTELQLCRDVYHCPPDRLAEQPFEIVALHLEFMDAETQVQRQRAHKG